MTSGMKPEEIARKLSGERADGLAAEHPQRGAAEQEHAREGDDERWDAAGRRPRSPARRRSAPPATSVSSDGEDRVEPERRP